MWCPDFSPSLPITIEILLLIITVPATQQLLGMRVLFCAWQGCSARCDGGGCNCWSVYYHSAALSFEVCDGICQLLQDYSYSVFLAVCICFCYKKSSGKAVACLLNEKCFITVSAAYRGFRGWMRAVCVWSTLTMNGLCHPRLWVFLSIFCLLTPPFLFFIGLARPGISAGLKKIMNVLFNK